MQADLMLQHFDLPGCDTTHLQGSGKMTVQVKTPKEKQAVEVEEGATIKQVSIPTVVLHLHLG